MKAIERPVKGERTPFGPVPPRDVRAGLAFPGISFDVRTQACRR